MVNGEGIEDELARRLVRSMPSLKEVQSGISDRIDKANYSGTVDSDRGVAINYRSTSQRNAKMQVFCRADEKLRNHSMKKMNNSFSTTYTQRGFPGYAREAVAWKQWRAHLGFTEVARTSI